MVAAAVGAGVVASGVYGASQSKKAAGKAADAQTEASQAGIEEQRRQFDKVQELLSPYVKAGTGSLAAQQNLIGLNGAKAQADAIAALRASPAYTSAMRSGTDTINANASATGGLRGGNTQEALGRFGGDLLTNLVQSQFSNLGGITNLGQNSAAQTGSAAMASGNNIAGLLQQQGAAQAGGYIAQGNANAAMANSFTSGLGAFLGAGGKF